MFSKVSLTACVSRSFRSWEVTYIDSLDRLFLCFTWSLSMATVPWYKLHAKIKKTRFHGLIAFRAQVKVDLSQINLKTLSTKTNSTYLGNRIDATPSNFWSGPFDQNSPYLNEKWKVFWWICFWDGWGNRIAQINWKCLGKRINSTLSSP